jgi:hypothetical protein
MVAFRNEPNQARADPGFHPDAPVGRSITAAQLGFMLRGSTVIAQVFAAKNDFPRGSLVELVQT